VPPPGRHVLVTTVPSVDATTAVFAAMAGHVVVVGTDDPARVAGMAPHGARVAPLGRMQHPPLDGPVDRRRF